MGWYMTELFQSSPTSKKCMRLLPPLSKGDGTQQVVLANQNGVVWCLRWKKQPMVEFKTFPGQRTDALTLAGDEDVGADKIFFASGSIVNGYNRRGKHFLAFETNKTDLITCMAIHGVEMILCSSHTMTHYHDCIETFHYLSDDAILDVACFETTTDFNEDKELCIVLACENHSIKLLCGNHLVTETEISAAPNILHPAAMDTEPQKTKEKKILIYGTLAGSIGEIAVYSNKIEHKWEVPPVNGCAVINAIECCDLQGDGSVSMLAGRDDGTVEMYHYVIGEGITLTDCLRCPGSVVALQCGNFRNTTKLDILACTYSGKLLAWTADEPFSSSVKDENAALLENQFSSLRTEIDKLREEVKSRRAKYVISNQQKATMSRLPVFPIEERLFLNDQDTVHHLNMELPVSIDWVIFRTEVAVDLVDVGQNSAIFSLIENDRGSPDALMATYRCQANMTRFEMSMRTIEGKYGNLEFYVSPRTNPTVCQLRSYPIKPLSLHRRTAKFDESRPHNKLTIKGKFGVFEAYNLVASCLPGMAEQPPEGEDVSCYFVSCFTGTQLHITCKQNEIVARSDNLSTVTILQDVINHEGSKLGWKLDITNEMNLSTVPFVLNLVGERLREWSDMLKKITYAEILKDVTIHPEEEESLTTEFKEVLRNSNIYLNRKSGVQAHMERMKDILSGY
uniref:Bardet-Biedl syndrome 7 protein homolog n=1 Tax=Trichuris muris TaxID=70415 RepID=A0A5S6QVZ7_TRIMR